MSATPEALSFAPCVARGGTSRLAMTMMVPGWGPCDTAHTVWKATARPATVAGSVSMCVSSPAALNWCSTHRPARLSASLPATRCGKPKARVRRSVAACAPSKVAGSWLSRGMSVRPSVKRATTAMMNATTQAARYTLRFGSGTSLREEASYQNSGGGVCAAGRHGYPWIFSRVCVSPPGHHHVHRPTSGREHGGHNLRENGSPRMPSPVKPVSGQRGE